MVVVSQPRPTVAIRPPSKPFESGRPPNLALRRSRIPEPFTCPPSLSWTTAAIWHQSSTSQPWKSPANSPMCNPDSVKALSEYLTRPPVFAQQPPTGAIWDQPSEESQTSGVRQTSLILSLGLHNLLLDPHSSFGNKLWNPESVSLHFSS